MKASRRIKLVEVLVILFIIGILASLLFPTGGGIDPSPKSRAKNDVTQIATAVTPYETEYGRPLTSTNGLVDGDLLATITGSNVVLNPRKIVFIEPDLAIKGEKGGLRDGAFVDPWGGIYRISIAADTTPVIAGTNHIELKKKEVAVWNDPSTHPDRASDLKKNRRYVTSWE